jgi:hypothetical protein
MSYAEESGEVQPWMNKISYQDCHNPRPFCEGSTRERFAQKCSGQNLGNPTQDAGLPSRPFGVDFVPAATLSSVIQGGLR